MNSPQRNKRIRGGVAIVVMAMCIFAANYVYEGALTKAVQHVASPALSFGGSLYTIVSPEDVTQKNIEEENKLLRAEIARLADTELENVHLHSVLAELQLISDVASPLVARTYATPVIARAGVALYGTVLVAQDDQYSTAPGARVYGPQGFVIGTIDTVTDTSALVRIVSAHGNTYHATVQDASGATLGITIEGRGHGNFVAYVPRDAAIDSGVFVYADATGIEPVGVVQETFANPTDAVRTVRIHLPFVIEALRFVRVEHSL